MPLSSSYHDCDDKAGRRSCKTASPAAPHDQPARSTTPRASRGSATHRSATPPATATQLRPASPSSTPLRVTTTASTKTPAKPAAPAAGPSPWHGTENGVAVAALTSAALAQTGLRTTRQPPPPATPSKSPAASRRPGGSREESSFDATTRQSHRGVTPRSAVPFVSASKLPTRALSKAPWLVAEHRPKAAPSRATVSEGRSLSRSPGNATRAVAARPLVLRAASSGPDGASLSSAAGSRLSHPRPLLSSKEADYLNFAHQRGFLGRFRCAASVVVRSPATATSHTPKREHPQPGCTAEGAEEKEEDGHARASAASTPAAAPMAVAGHYSHKNNDDRHAANLGLTQQQRQHQQEQEHEKSPEPANTATAAGAGHPAYMPGMLQTPRRTAGRRLSSSAASVASGGGGTMGRRRSSTSLLNGLGARSVASASAAGTGAGPDAKAQLTRAQSGGVPAANIAPLVQSGLHTSLWLAAQDGALEVRSMANPNHVLATLPRRDARAVVTSLVQVCGNRVVAGRTDGSLHVYDATTMAAVTHVPAHTGAVTCLVYVRNAPRLRAASGSNAQHRGTAGTLVAIAPTQSVLVSASLDRTLGVWDAATMAPLHRLKGTLCNTCALVATMTGGYVVSGTDDGTLRLWDVVHGTQLTVTNEERAQIAAGAANVAQIDSSPPRRRLPQPLAVPTAGIAAAAGPSETVPNTTNPRNKTSPAPYQFPQPLTLSVTASSSSMAAQPAMGTAPAPFPSSQRSESRRRSLEVLNFSPQHPHQQQRHGSGPASAPLIVRGTQQLAKPGTCHSSRLSSVPQPAASLGMPAQDEVSFAPLDSDVTDTLFTESSLLVGPGGCISPVRRCSRADRGGSDDSCSDGDDESMSGGGSEKEKSAIKRATSGATPRTATTPGPRTPLSLRRAIKKRAKDLNQSHNTSADSPSPKSRASKVASGSGSTKLKRASRKSTKRDTAPPSPSPSPPSASLPGWQSTPAGAAAAPAEAPPQRRRSSVAALEHRLELWLQHYQRRVLTSAAAVQLMQRLPAGYDAASSTNWPVKCAHTDYVVALALVEDRLLVSASRDATAKVFALPSGQYMRTLSSSRRMPLAGVLYDASLGRLYTAFSDGGVAAYDMLQAELPLLTLLQSPQTILSSTFVPLTVGPMHRFVFAASAVAPAASTPVGAPAAVTEDATPVMLGVAQYDRHTMAHGPNQTVTSYRVGQPSLRELNAAVSLVPLQQHRAHGRAALADRAAKGSLEERELVALGCYGRVLKRCHAQWRAQAVLSRWRRWVQLRAQRKRCVAAASVQAEKCTAALGGRYLRQWRVWTHERTSAAAGALLREVQLRASAAPLLDTAAEVRAADCHGWGCVADAMAAHQRARLRAAAYGQWRAFLRLRQTQLRQCTAYNRLLLSMNWSSYTPACRTLTELTRVSVRRANRAAALRVVTQRTERSATQARRRHGFDVWRTWVRQEVRRPWSSGAGTGWSAVEPLSFTLVQAQLLRRRCFARWQAFAVYVARTEQLAHERKTLQMEYEAIEKALATPMSATAMTEAVQVATTATAAAAAEAKELQTQLDAVSHDVATLRTESALHMLIAGYRVPSVVQPASAVTITTAAAAGATPAESWSTASLRRGSRASMSSGTTLSSSVGGRGHVAAHVALPSTVADSNVSEEEQRRRQEEDTLLFEASAVLRALKGNAMQCARDDRLLAAAHALAQRLPIHEPLPNGRTSVGTRAGPAPASAGSPGGSRRQAGWSVSNAKSGGGITATTTTAAGVSATSPQSSPRRRLTTSTPSAGGAAAASPNAAQSAAQMWAAQPAEQTYASLADAFDAIFMNLVDLLHVASRECGAESLTSRGAGHASASGDAVAIPASWLAQVPLKQRRVMMGEVLKLVTVFDSFAAHNDLPVECAGSISTRGTANTRALPLCSLCSRSTAGSLLEQASVLLELVDPQLWPRQLQLNHLQDAYAAAIAELNAAVSSTGLGDTVPHAATTMTVSSTGSEDAMVSSASPAPAVPLMKPSALCLSPEVLQEAAGAAMPWRDGVTAANVAAGGGSSRRPSSTRAGSGPLSAGRRPHRSASSVRSGGPAGGIAAFTLPDPCHSGGNGHLRTSSHGGGDRGQAVDEGFNDTLRSIEEEGATPTPELVHPRSMSFSHRTFSAVSTPRSYTSRTATSSVGATVASAAVAKAYLGFRVNVVREAQAQRRCTISIREVVPQYVNADGEELDSPAQVAGLQVGDQLVRFAGYTVTDLAAFNTVVARHAHTGAELPLVVLRGGEQLSKTITVGSRAAVGV